jgi:NTP pyrophosphatase (non-canonical NTP hydrolase)
MKEKLTLQDIQHIVDNWIQEHGGYWTPLSMLSAVIEELGELSKEINNLEGYKPKKKQNNGESRLQEELADLFFSIVCIANYYDINLNKEFLKIVEKYSRRNSKRFH